MKNLINPLFSNNSRKLYGLPLRRKASKGKRFKTRCTMQEDIYAFLDYCDETPNNIYLR